MPCLHSAHINTSIHVKSTGFGYARIVRIKLTGSFYNLIFNTWTSWTVTFTMVDSTDFGFLTFLEIKSSGRAIS